MNRLTFALPVLAIVFLLGCEESPTEIAGDTAPLFKKGGKPGGGGGGGGPADPAIAFRSNGALRVMNADGSNSTVVVTDFGDGLFGNGLAWSPLGDGSATAPYRIVFELGGGPLATVAITTPADGGIVATLPSTIVATTTRGFTHSGRPAWSPDGSRIAFHANLGEVCDNGEGQGEFDLWTMSVVSTPDGVEGSDLKRHTYNCDNYVFVWGSSWSPDGNAIAFLEQGGGTTAIKILHMDDGSIETAFDAAWLPEISMVRDDPDWGRDETEPKLVFTAIRIKAGRKHPEPVFAVYTLPLQKDASGHYSKAGLPKWEVDGRRPSWSPDDTRFVMDGVTIYDRATDETTRLANGEMADWRR
jgi:hypothetical protein